MRTPEGSAITFVINGPIARADLPGLYRRVCTMLEHSDAAVAFCDVHDVNPDAVAVDALARLHLAARAGATPEVLARTWAEDPDAATPEDERSAKLRERYRVAALEQRRVLLADIRSSRAQLLEISTETPVTTQLVSFLRTRQAMRGGMRGRRTA